VHGAETQQFRGWIAQQLGLHFDDTKLEFLTEVLARRADKHHLAFRLYLDRLERPGIDEELRALALELTVPETYFFRHMDQFRAFADVALPRAQAARMPIRKLSILSAGCASGEEPYSLAMLVRERGADAGWHVDIRALDINAAMLAKAARGVYSAWALRETPAESQRRWFRRVGEELELERSVRTSVIFREANLAQEDADLWVPQSYDVIFCRNLLMYFTADCARALVARLTRSLAPGGHLFLGHAETLRGLSGDFHLCQTHGTFYYQRKQHPEHLGGSEPSRIQVSPSTEPAPRAASSLPEPVWTKTWLETIQHASDRIKALTNRPGARPAPPGAPKSGVPAGTTLQLVLDLLRSERFTEALDLLGGLPEESEEDPDALLLRAALLTHSGNLGAAERVSGELLERDELNAGAHYLLALCRESAGDLQGAVEHDQAAIYLDAGFSMARLHLGLMARRAGDLQGAGRELAHALTLLEREDASRLLLYGGGFGREALIALCRAELKSAGRVS
jgi:chemotaxis protein methyltransferase CheR